MHTKNCRKKLQEVPPSTMGLNPKTAETLDETAETLDGRNWTRTSDPHDVNVVL